MQFSFLLSLFVWSAYKHSCISPISSNKYPPAAWSGYCTNKAMTEFTHKHMGLIHMLTKANTCMYTDWEPESCRKCWQALVNRGSAVSPSASLTTHAHSSSGSHPDANTQIMLVYPCMCEIHFWSSLPQPGLAYRGISPTWPTVCFLLWRRGRNASFALWLVKAGLLKWRSPLFCSWRWIYTLVCVHFILLHLNMNTSSCICAKWI